MDINITPILCNIYHDYDDYEYVTRCLDNIYSSKIRKDHKVVLPYIKKKNIIKKKDKVEK
jgi:hypothetical protein